MLAKNNNHPFVFPLLLASLITLGLCASPQVMAQDLRKLVELKGIWAFSIGDDMAWAEQRFNDAGWDHLYVPKKWEDQGYIGYNGYAWYRKHFTIAPVGKNFQILLVIGAIDDVDEVFINGKRIGGMGNAEPTMYETAYQEKRKYSVPSELIDFSGDNVIAVRVFDNHIDGGILKSPVGLYYDMNTALLNINLAGQWRFSTGDDPMWKTEGYDDARWAQVYVPSKWEKQGYDDYDGTAWYRKSFRLPQRLMLENLYLVMGKVDDVDQVYVNGHKIGSVFQIKKENQVWRNYKDHEVFRGYRLPKDVLKPGQENQIAVRVTDTGGGGGIYQGPIGIATEDNFELIESRYYSNNGKSIIEYFLQEIFE